MAFSFGALSRGRPGRYVGNSTRMGTGTWSGASIGPDGAIYVCLCQSGGGGKVYALDGATGAKPGAHRDGWHHLPDRLCQGSWEWNLDDADQCHAPVQPI